jgi:hypothetical protein
MGACVARDEVILDGDTELDEDVFLVQAPQEPPFLLQ